MAEKPETGGDGPEFVAGLTFRLYQEADALRRRLTEQGANRALAESEIDELRQARDVCNAYHDVVFAAHAGTPESTAVGATASRLLGRASRVGR